MKIFGKTFQLIIVFITLLIFIGCTKPVAPSDNANTAPKQNANAVTVQPTTAPVQTETPTTHEPSLVSLSSGAFPVKKPQEYSGAYSTLELLDERPRTNWSSPEGVLDPQTLVLQLPEKTLLKTVIFDCTGYNGSADMPACAKDVTVEMSDTSETDGFQKIADVSLEVKDNQTFPVSGEVPGRWVRLTIKNNHGAKDFIQLNDFRATGTQLTHTPMTNVSGTYDTSLGDMHIKQEGTSVSGCYYTRGGIFEGGIEGRVIKLSWCDNCGASSEKRGTAVFVFSPNDKQFMGGYSDENHTTEHLSGWDGTKKSNDIGSCDNWAATGFEEQVAKDLERDGKVRLYGINFDTDADVIKDESKPTLDKIINILKKNSSWKLKIEGHTDSTSTAEHNQKLSEKRAEAVKNYLQTGGIEASRLTTAGYGDTKPLGDNETGLGRAQNRRVELIRQ